MAEIQIDGYYIIYVYDRVPPSVDTRDTGTHGMSTIAHDAAVSSAPTARPCRHSGRSRGGHPLNIVPPMTEHLYGRYDSTTNHMVIYVCCDGSTP